MSRLRHELVSMGEVISGERLTDIVSSVRTDDCPQIGYNTEGDPDFGT